MAYASDHGIWPRAKPQPPGPETGLQLGPGPQPAPGPIPTPTPRDGETTFTAEGLLKEALIRLWEQARARRVEKIGSLSIRMFDATDAFRLLAVVAAVRGADRKQAKFEGGYETTNGSTMEVGFTGTPTTPNRSKTFSSLSYGPPRRRTCRRGSSLDSPRALR